MLIIFSLFPLGHYVFRKRISLISAKAYSAAENIYSANLDANVVRAFAIIIAKHCT